MSATSSGARVGAFFDIDGTLLAAPSIEWRFVSWLETYGALGFWQIARWTAGASAAFLSGEFGAIRTNKTYLAGLPVRFARDWESSLGADALAPFLEGAARIVWHLKQNHRVFLISGTLGPLAEIFAQRLGSDIESQGTNLELIDGRWTGFIEGNHMSGREKTRAVAALANHYCMSLTDSFAYGNETSDLAMLEAVGNPVVVNPSLRFRRIARLRGWKIERWNSLQSANAASNQALLSPTAAR